MQAFRTGQLASYLGFAHKALMCPTDAGNYPREGISQRHGGGRASKAQVDVKGGASVGLLDGSAGRITYQAYYQMSGPPAGGLPLGSTIQRSVPAPNDLYFDPRDRWGGVVHQPAVDGQ